ncbi:MAG: uracil-DNA glycosylase [Candidatus Saccharibacteria bacterium]|nr:uracil-DNA glycosylase [Candidatus Saccharibacteria bacterium]
MKYHTWREFVEAEAEQPYFRQLMNRVDAERQRYEVYPPREDMFSCFRYCPLDAVKVVIIGQDPYHGPVQAHGMSFSVRPGVKLPPSLQNIFKELHDDVGVEAPTSGFLEPWARQGVLLMNTAWSVRRGQAGSHADYGWAEFSQHVLQLLNDYEQPLVFILWGAHAQKVGQVITSPRHLKITSAHPSPFSAARGFFGSRPFSRANQFLAEHGRGEIDWRLP